METEKSFKQNLSVLVRARILFAREIDIDRGSGKNIFNKDYFLRLVEVKKTADLQMQKLLVTSAGSTMLLYLLGKGMAPEVPLWGLKLSAIPGAIVFLSLFASFSVVFAALAFYNSQAYSSLIDQVLLDETERGKFDVDMLKASYEHEWLIFKALRSEFSFYAPVHIRYGSAGRAASFITFALLVFVALMPFLALMIAVPILSFTYLPDGWVGTATSCFVVVCALSVFLLVLVTSFDFECEVDLN
jgi:hypothetical protein